MLKYLVYYQAFRVEVRCLLSLLLFLLLLFLYLNSVKILKYKKFTYKLKLIKVKASFLQYKPALFTPNVKND